MVEREKGASVPSKTDAWSYECPCCYSSYEPEDRPADGRCAKCEESPNLREKQSEFGAGMVVCLAKFSEHLWCARERDVYTYDRWTKMSEEQQARQIKEASDFPYGDAAERMRVVRRFRHDEEGFHRYPSLAAGCETPEAYAIHQAIAMWANAAGDHFFDLDEDRAPHPLRELADLVIQMRNTHLRDEVRVWTVDDLERVRELWRESCIALDEALGTSPNWGEY